MSGANSEIRQTNQGGAENQLAGTLIAITSVATDASNTFSGVLVVVC